MWCGAAGVIYAQVQRQLSATAKGSFEAHFLAGARRYVHSIPLAFVSLLCGCAPPASARGCRHL